MKQKVSVEGRSLFFNVLFVVLNLIGLSLVVIGSHAAFKDLFLLFNFIGYVLMAISTAGLFIFRGRLMMSNVSRVLVGSLFIVSGLVKANDPVGFAYKLEEYFEDGALAYRIKELFGAPGFSLEFLIDSALTLSVVICVLEIALGVLTIIGGKIKLISCLMVGMMLFFTFLTWHTANCDPAVKFRDRNTYSLESSTAQSLIKKSKSDKSIKIISRSAGVLIVDEMKQPQCVTDCGCFGDALKGSVGRSLTANESFWKDIVLLYLVVWIFLGQWITQPNSKRQNVIFGLLSLLLITGFSWVFGWYFPIVFAFIALLMALWILRAGGYFLGNHWGSLLIVSSISLILITYVLLYEPLKDYRPYAVGKNLLWQMNDRKDGKFENTFVLKNLKTGEVETYSEKQYMDNKDLWDETRYKFVKMSQEVIVPEKPATISQFNPFIDIQDLSSAERDLPFIQEMIAAAKVDRLIVRDKITYQRQELNMSDFAASDTSKFVILDTVEIADPEFKEISIKDFVVRTNKIYVLTTPDLMKANWKKIERYKEIYAGCQRDGIPFILITNASRKQIDEFRRKYNFNVPVFLNDGIELKAIARSNPSLMVLQRGVVKAKYPHRSTPKYAQLKKIL